MNLLNLHSRNLCKNLILYLAVRRHLSSTLNVNPTPLRDVWYVFYKKIVMNCYNWRPSVARWSNQFLQVISKLFTKKQSLGALKNYSHSLKLGINITFLQFSIFTTLENIIYLKFSNTLFLNVCQTALNICSILGYSCRFSIGLMIVFW